jgi:hypothetical protein
MVWRVDRCCLLDRLAAKSYIHGTLTMIDLLYIAGTAG